MTYSALKTASQKTAPISFSAEMDIFTHHFPQTPILPGALSAFLLAEASGGDSWSLRKINGIRFRKPLSPNTPVTISWAATQESPTEKTCSGKIMSGTDTIADGEFVFAKSALSMVEGAKPSSKECIWTAAQIREYLPHGEPIVLIDELVEAQYPPAIQEKLAQSEGGDIDQTLLVGTKVHTRSQLRPGSFWLDQSILPSPVLSELAAQASALTLAPFFKGTKPQVSLLGCDTEYFACAREGAVIDTFVELTRVKRLGKTANMILFKGECHVGNTKIAQVNLNAMASFGA